MLSSGPAPTETYQEREIKMKSSKALVVIDLQNDITKNYREIIDRVNRAIIWADSCGMAVIYIRHLNLSATGSFREGT